MLITIGSIYSINDNGNLIIRIYGKVNDHWWWPHNTDVASKNPVRPQQYSTKASQSQTLNSRLLPRVKACKLIQGSLVTLVEHQMVKKVKCIEDLR
jgi:hypothetical protein